MQQYAITEIAPEYLVIWNGSRTLRLTYSAAESMRVEQLVDTRFIRDCGDPRCSTAFPIPNANWYLQPLDPGWNEMDTEIHLLSTTVYRSSSILKYAPCGPCSTSSEYIYPYGYSLDCRNLQHRHQIIQLQLSLFRKASFQQSI